MKFSWISQLIQFGFAILELKKLLMHDTCYNKLQPNFGQDNLPLDYMDCDSFVLRLELKKFLTT